MFTGLARLGILVVVLLLVCSTTVLPKEPEEIWRDLGKLSGEERQRFLAAHAKAEGEVSWYTSLAADQLEPLREDFENRYPGIKIKAWRSRGEAVSNRVLTEARAGKFSVDVISGSNEYLPILMKAELVARYSSPERELFSEPNKDQEGYWVSLGNLVTVVVYNTNLVPKSEAPKRYEDFLDPKWRGNFAIDTNPDRAVMTWLKVWGNDKTEKFLQGLISNGALIRSGHTLITQVLCAGEFKAAIELYASRVVELIKRGCPAEMVFVDPVPAAVTPLYVVKRSPHPFGASLLVDYILSDRGQRILSEKGLLHSGRRGIKPGYPELDLDKQGVRPVLLRPDDLEQLGKKYFDLRERYLLIR